MKKLSLLFIGILSMSNVMAQDISDALRYSSDEIQGTARFRAMSGAFGALGGDMSAVSLNPAGAAVFTRSHASASVSILSINNDVNYFGEMRSSSDSKLIYIKLELLLFLITLIKIHHGESLYLVLLMIKLLIMITIGLQLEQVQTQ